MSERRLHPRTRTQTEATLVCNQGLVRLDAMIMDRGAGGVRIRLAEDRKIENGSYLLFDRRIEPVSVVWQASNSVGLKFIA